MTSASRAPCDGVGRHDGNIRCPSPNIATVLTIREADGALTPGEALRELLHDATEFMLGWDCITPLKAQLGEPFRALEARLQSAIDTRYRLPEWTPEAYAADYRIKSRSTVIRPHIAQLKRPWTNIPREINARSDRQNI